MVYADGTWGVKAKERNKRRTLSKRIYNKAHYIRTRKQIIGERIPENVVDKFIENKELVCEKCFIPNSSKPFKGLLIHHMDGNRHNNVLENFMLLCRACHNKVHMTKQ